MNSSSIPPMPSHNRVKLTRDCEALRVPQGDRITLPAGTAVTIVQSLPEGHTVMTRRRQTLRIAAADSDALGLPVSERQHAPAAEPAQPGQPPPREEHCLEVLKTCYDPEWPVNVVDLGLVYACRVTPLASGGQEVVVEMTLTSPACPMGDVLKQEIEEKLLELPGVERARVEIVFDPPWDPSRLSEAALLELGLL